MKLFKPIIPIVLVITLIASGGVFAKGHDSVQEKHWVYDELPDFKKQIVPIVGDINDHLHKTVTKEEWMSVHATVLNDKNLDEPIQIYHWATLLKMILELPEKQTDQLLDMYVYPFSQGNEVLREDAVGGLVKLLTLKHISGSSTAEDMKGSEALKDLDQISEKQKELVRIAYTKGILDGTTTDHFRPKDSLTNAEAVSILYRVNIILKPGLTWPQNHWSVYQVEPYLQRVKPSGELLDVITHLLGGNSSNTEPQAHLNQPINIKDWNNLLRITLKLENSKYEKNFWEDYTYGLSESGHITRDKAVAGIMKLLIVADLKTAQHVSRDASEEEKAAAASAFIDFDQVWDQSKFSLAYREGLIAGSEGKRFYPDRPLTNGEAMVFIARIAKKYY
jgi:hypothetical protein